MTVMKSIGDFFRASDPTSKGKMDKFGILSPLMTEAHSLETMVQALDSIRSNKALLAILTNKQDTRDPHHAVAANAYKHFYGSLSGSLRAKESHQPLSTLIAAATAIESNLQDIEGSFDHLFGSMTSPEKESVVRTSSLLVIGYIEQTSMLTTWVSRLYAYITSDEHSILSPFWEKSLINDTRQIGTFVTNNLERWKDGGIVGLVTTIQSKNADFVVKSGNNYIDDFVHDHQYNDHEKSLMSASLFSPIMWFHDARFVARQKKIELLENRQKWLISKIAFQEARMRNMDPNSPEYRRMQKAVDYYENLVTKLEQDIERKRA